MLSFKPCYRRRLGETMEITGLHKGHRPHEEEIVSFQLTHYVHVSRRIPRSSSRYAQSYRRSDFVRNRGAQRDVTQTTFKHDGLDRCRSGWDERLRAKEHLVPDIPGGARISHKREYHVSE